MESLLQKIKWLKTMGVTYYLEEKPSLNLNNYVNSNKDKKDNIDIINEQVMIYKAELSQDIPQSLARKLADGATSIEILKEYVENFEGCDLKKFATNTVFAQGNKSAKVMLIGEAPGATEDQKGIPFCGESGMLLDNMLKAINLSREENVYITNTIFWRPPANRVPTQEEIEICRPFVEKHIALINPKIIVLVGSTASTSLFGKHAGITKIRGEYLSYTNKYLKSPIVTTSIFHPAYLLRQPMQKKTSWGDLLKLQQFLKENE